MVLSQQSWSLMSWKISAIAGDNTLFCSERWEGKLHAGYFFSFYLGFPLEGDGSYGEWIFPSKSLSHHAIPL